MASNLPGEEQPLCTLPIKEPPEDGSEACLVHVEAFNILCVGESGLGKSTFLRDIFAHLDPIRTQELKMRLEEQAATVDALNDAIDRNDKEGRQCDDHRSLVLRKDRRALKARRDEAVVALEELRRERHTQEHKVATLRAEIGKLDERLRELRGRRDAEPDDEEAERLGEQVLAGCSELKENRAQLALELHRSNLDRAGEAGEPPAGKQTTEVTARLIKRMPLFDGARHALDVTLIDTPGYGDLLVDTATSPSADKVCAEVDRRISAHLDKRVATRGDMPLIDEKKYWNELVHVCLFFISPHRLKRADVDLMRRLHDKVPLVVVIAKSDTMTKTETLEFKEKVRGQLQESGVRTFAFEPKLVKEVEEWHAEGAPEDFSPLYGGCDGNWPWAVMGADESRREYVWGTALTNEPIHSEMPALRDLLLRAGGWQQLKLDALKKADKEGMRRADACRLHSSCFQIARAAWAAVTRHVQLAAMVVVAVAVLLLAGEHASAHLAYQRGVIGGLRLEVASLQQQLEQAADALDADTSEIRRQCDVRLHELADDLAQCTDVRKALEEDLKVLNDDLSSTSTTKRTSRWW